MSSGVSGGEVTMKRVTGPSPNPWPNTTVLDFWATQIIVIYFFEIPVLKIRVSSFSRWVCTEWLLQASAGPEAAHGATGKAANEAQVGHFLWVAGSIFLGPQWTLREVFACCLFWFYEARARVA